MQTQAPAIADDPTTLPMTPVKPRTVAPPIAGAPPLATPVGSQAANVSRNASVPPIAPNLGAAPTGASPKAVTDWQQDHAATSTYQGPPLDRFGQLVTPNTESDGAGGFRPSVPLDGATGLPMGFSWGDIGANGIGGASGSPPPFASGADGPAAGVGPSDALNPNAQPSATGVPPIAGTPGLDAAPTVANTTTSLASDTANNPAGVDRYGLATRMLGDFAKSSDPYYQKSLRDATSQAAGAGRLGSGQLRTSLGDLAYNRDLQLNSAGNSFLTNALGGSIDDAYKNYGLAQEDQRTAFGQGATQIQLEEALRQGDFSRYLALLNAGEANNPTNTALTLSGQYNNQAGQAAQGAAGLVGSSVANGTQNTGADAAFQEWLKQQMGGGVPAMAGVPNDGSLATDDPNAWGWG